MVEAILSAMTRMDLSTMTRMDSLASGVCNHGYVPPSHLGTHPYENCTYNKILAMHVTNCLWWLKASLVGILPVFHRKNEWLLERGHFLEEIRY